jgi:magnesium-transporting ATPase (P-type)
MINGGTEADLLPALALGLEPPSPRTLASPPEPPNSPLLTLSLALRTFLFYGLLESALGMAAFFAVFWVDGWRPFASLARFEAAAIGGATLTFLGIVGGQIGCLFAQRAGPLRVRLSLFRNPWIAFGIAVELAIVLVLVYVPGIDAIFSMTAVSPMWLLVLPIGAALVVAADQLRRALFDRKSPPVSARGQRSIAPRRRRTGEQARVGGRARCPRAPDVRCRPRRTRARRLDPG